MNGIRHNIIDLLQAMGSRRGRPHFRLVVGLGNPGPRYTDTRHNVGFWCLDHLAKVNSIVISQRRRHVEIGEGVIAGQPVVLAKTRTFMNESGRAVQSLLARYRSSPDDLLTIHDDMDLPVGKLRLRPRGSPGGHNGMRSVVDAIGSSDFPRLRIGIGRPSSSAGEVEYVLGAMSSEDRENVDAAVRRASEALVCLLAEGIDAAMDRFNR